MLSSSSVVMISPLKKEKIVWQEFVDFDSAVVGKMLLQAKQGRHHCYSRGWRCCKGIWFY
jgi:hypothetical protein